MRNKVLELLNLSESLERVGYQLMFTKTANNNLIINISENAEIIKSTYLDLNFDVAVEYKYTMFVQETKKLIRGLMIC